MIRLSLLTLMPLFAALASAAPLPATDPLLVSLPFSERNAECERSTIWLRLDGSLDEYTLVAHRRFHNREGVVPPTLPRFCRTYFDPLLSLAEKHGGRLEITVLTHPDTDQCCKIVGGSIHAPKLACWPVPAETVRLTLPNGLTLRSKLALSPCPLTP